MAKKEKQSTAKNPVVDVLNKARARELGVIFQYMAQHYGLEDAGYGRVASEIKKIAIVEMKHAEAFAERIVELGGEPTYVPAMSPKKDLKITDAVEFDMGLEDGAVVEYNEYAEVARKNRDSISARLFERIIDEEQGHFNYFQNLRDHILELGDAYLARLASRDE